MEWLGRLVKRLKFCEKRFWCDVLFVWPSHGAKQDADLLEIIGILKFAEYTKTQIRLEVEDAALAVSEIDSNSVITKWLY